MKKYFQKSATALIAIALMATALTAAAQVSTIDFLSSGTIYSNVSKATGFTDVKIDKHKEVGLQFKFQGDRATTGTMTFTLARSMDGTTFETTPRMIYAVAANGNTVVTLCTNLTSTWVGPYKYIRMVSVANADANAALNFTNLQFSAVIKKGN